MSKTLESRGLPKFEDRAQAIYGAMVALLAIKRIPDGRYSLHDDEMDQICDDAARLVQAVGASECRAFMKYKEARSGDRPRSRENCMLKGNITFGMEAAIVACDGKCNKAFGINGRPKVTLSENEDDYYYIPDGDLGEAPIDPRSYEGIDAKPLSPDEFPNHWCVRECERSTMVRPGEPIVLDDFSKRVYNNPSRNGAE